MLPISVCIITKNEANKIERCLSSITSYGFEIIIVDTGSTDDTMKLAATFTNKLYSFHWINDFSAARNHSLNLATNDWILMLDCDEWIDTLDCEELLYFMTHFPTAVGSVTRQNYVGSPDNPSLRNDQTERFFSRRHYHYTGIIHEQLTPKAGIELNSYLLRTTIYHDGYCMTPAQQQQKARRNLTYMKQQLAAMPDDPYQMYQMGKAYILAGDTPTAISWYEKAFDYPLDTSLAYVQAMVISYGELLLELNQPQQALLITNLYDDFTDSADYLYLAGRIYQANNQHTEAFTMYQQAANCPHANQEGCNSYLPYYQMAYLLLLDENYPLMEEYLLKCGDYPPALDILHTLHNTAD